MNLIEDKLRQTFNIPYSMKVKVRGSRKPQLTIIFIHGIGVSGDLWNKHLDKIAKKDYVRTIVVDLIGFGQSNKSDWQTFNLETQARSLHTTLINNLIFIGKKDPLLIVGHSLGTLVAIKFAKMYPHLVNYLLLISPPIYKLDKTEQNLQQQALLRFYNLMIEKPALFERTWLAIHNFMHFDAKEDDKARDVFLTTLESAIVKQDSYQDILSLQIPSLIYYGALDPLVIDANLVEVDDKSPFIWSHKIIGSHDINRLMFKKISAELNKIVDFFVK